MDPVEKFNKEKKENIKNLGAPEYKALGLKFAKATSAHNYSYNFSWMGRPIIQFPQDMVAMQEIIWAMQPDLIIETGIAHGGSLIYYASILELIGKGEVLGVDIEIRPHNKEAIEKHRMFERISMIEGSSTAQETIAQVKECAEGKERVMVCLDSNHTHAHVLEELRLYAPFVSRGGYLVVFDTIVEDVGDELFMDRPWSSGNSPKSAVKEFLRENSEFVVDEEIENKLVLTVCPGGYLKRL